MIIVRSSHDALKMCVCPSVRVIELKKRWTGLDETWCRCYAVGWCRKLQSLVPAWDERNCDVGSKLAPRHAVSAGILCKMKNSNKATARDGKIVFIRSGFYPMTAFALVCYAASVLPRVVLRCYGHEVTHRRHWGHVTPAARNWIVTCLAPCVLWRRVAQIVSVCLCFCLSAWINWRAAGRILMKFGVDFVCPLVGLFSPDSG